MSRLQSGPIVVVVFVLNKQSAGINGVTGTHTVSVSVRPTPVIEFPESPMTMIASPRNMTLRLAFGFRSGATAVWPLTDESCSFAEELTEPFLACTRNGLFVAVCRLTGRIECYRLNASSAELVAELQHPIGGDTLIGLQAGQAPNEFLLLRESGCLEKMLIPIR